MVQNLPQEIEMSDIAMSGYARSEKMGRRRHGSVEAFHDFFWVLFWDSTTHFANMDIYTCS